MFAHGETVTRLRAALIEDPYSGEETLADWNDPENPPAELVISGCGFDPGGTTQRVEIGREPVVTKPKVYTDFGVDITPADRLVVRGKTYDVDGEPADWRSPFSGWEPGAVIELKIVEG